MELNSIYSHQDSTSFILYTIFMADTKKTFKNSQNQKKSKKIERKILKKSKYEPEVVVHEEQDLKWQKLNNKKIKNQNKKNK